MANIDFPSSPTVGQQYAFAGVTYTYTTQGTWVPTAGSTAAAGTASPQGRLTLQSETPVMIVSTSGSAAIYYSPYVGNRIPIYDGTKFVATEFNEIPGTTTDTVHSPTPIVANKCNDWFVWNDAGTLRLTHGPDWTNDTTRAANTALVRTKGIWLNAVNITNGPAALRGTYVGSTRSSATALLEWVYGESNVGGIAANFAVWNCFNRVSVQTLIRDTTSSWIYGGDWRPANGSVKMRVNYMFGLAEDSYLGIIASACNNDHGAAAYIGFGFDVINAPSGFGTIGGNYNAGLYGPIPIIAEFSGLPILGNHFLQQLEFTGTNHTPTSFQSTYFGSLYTSLIFIGRM